MMFIFVQNRKSRLLRQKDGRRPWRKSLVAGYAWMRNQTHEPPPTSQPTSRRIYVTGWPAQNGLVDLTGPLAKAIPSYIPGNIQYADGTKNQPPPFWFHFVNLDDETGKNMPISSLLWFR